MAVVLRATLLEKVIFTADRGTQYTCTQIAELCGGLGLLQSVGRTGVCRDNAPSESFWSTLKTEFYNRRTWAQPMKRLSHNPPGSGLPQITCDAATIPTCRDESAR